MIAFNICFLKSLPFRMVWATTITLKKHKLIFDVVGIITLLNYLVITEKIGSKTHTASDVMASSRILTYRVKIDNVREYTTPETVRL